MSNFSDLTRKGQVLQYLKDRDNQWVDGPELATEQVGGSEGLRRIRELKADGHDIRMRQHPDTRRDIWQYRLVVGPTNPKPGTPITEFPRTIAIPPEALERDSYPRPEPRRPVAPPPSIGEAMRRKGDGTYEYVPPHRRSTDNATRPAPASPPEVHEQTDQGGLWSGPGVSTVPGQDPVPRGD